MVLAVVLDAELGVGVRQVEARDDSPRAVDHLVLENGFAETRAYEHEAEACLHG